MTTDQTKMALILKASLEFNAQIISLAAQVYASKNQTARTVHRSMSRYFEEYHKKVSAILKTEE